MKINIEKDHLRFGIYLGFKVSRLEYLWDSPFEKVAADFPSSKEEVLGLLPIDCKINEKSFHNFCDSILRYYFRENPRIFSAILIGICIQKSILIDVSLSDKVNDEIYTGALSALKSIPNDIVDNKEELFDLILKNINSCLKDKDFDLFNLIELISTSSNKFDQFNKKANDYIFISYSSEDSETVNKICELLKLKNINFLKAPECIDPGEDHASVIPTIIENCKIFFLIISEKSQISNWVPKELELAIKYNKIIIPFHIDNSPLKKDFKFRLLNVQRIEAYGRIEEEIEKLSEFFLKYLDDKNLSLSIDGRMLKRNRIFFAYSFLDTSTANIIKDSIIEENYQVLTAWDVESTSPQKEKIINSADIFIALLSSGGNSNVYIELGYALNSNSSIIVLVTKDMLIPADLMNYKILEVSKVPTKTEIETILREIKKHF